jgi:CubicO group peptidase (beta-lactamase class C family)
MGRVSAENLAKWAAEARERWSVPGIAVGLVDDGELVTAADGVPALGHAERVSPETVFRIASITKPFTATLVLTLVQDGLLQLDEPPPGTRVNATIRQLLSHQGGLAPEWPEPLGDGETLLELAQREPEPLPVGPGELFSYCNVGYWLVAAAVERVLGTNFEEAMSARVLEPLGIASTGFEVVDAARGHDQVAPGADEHVPAEVRYPPVRRAGGGLFSSVPDLLRFAAHHLGGPGPLTQEPLAELRRPLSSGPGFRYGMGWFLRERQGRRSVEHQGSVLGYQSLLLLAPDEKLAFAALTNSSRGYAAIRDVLRTVGLGDDEQLTLTDIDLAGFAGRYVGQGMIAELVSDDGLLRVERKEVDPFTGETSSWPAVRGRPVGEAEFEIVDGEWRGDRFDFPRPGFVCLDYRVLQAA